MRALPILLRVAGRRAVVVGADAPAVPKVRGLVDAGALITLIAPELDPALAALASDGTIEHVRREFRAGDFAGAVVAYASTRDVGLIERLSAEAETHRVLLNVIDVPDACAFFSPAVVRRGDLTIAVGTGGASPALSARLRAQLEEQFGPEFGPYLQILEAIRRSVWDRPGRAQVILDLVASPLLELLRSGDAAGIDELLRRLAGDDCTLDALGLSVSGGG